MIVSPARLIDTVQSKQGEKQTRKQSILSYEKPKFKKSAQSQVSNSKQGQYSGKDVGALESTKMYYTYKA